MLKEEQIAVLCDIAQSIAFADDMQGEVDRLIREGYVAKGRRPLRIDTEGAEAACRSRRGFERSVDAKWMKIPWGAEQTHGLNPGNRKTACPGHQHL